MLPLVLALALVLMTATSAPLAPVGTMPIVYQTWETTILGASARAWQDTWLDLGFAVRLVDPAGRRKTIQALSAFLGDPKVHPRPIDYVPP